jgi:hypothetical protein
MIHDTLLLVALGAWIAAEGEVYGSLRLGSDYLPDVNVALTCGGTTSSTKTDAYGLYRLYNEGTGKCVIQVSYQGQTPSLEIYSYDTAVRYRLVLERTGAEFSLRSE